mgnify:FL=1
MKKLLLILMLITSLSVSATSKDTLNAVTMVSYEQSWIDSEGTLALKNNTNEDIHSVTYRITYLNMKGIALDYRDFTSKIEIAPGMTKKVNIDAYEHGRHYSYYLSEESYDNSKKFKIKFELKGYNTSSADKTLENLNSIESYILIPVVIFVALLGLGLSVGLYVLVAVMANKRNRNVALWVLISIIATPLLAIIILLCIGKDYSQVYPEEDDADTAPW